MLINHQNILLIMWSDFECVNVRQLIFDENGSQIYLISRQKHWKWSIQPFIKLKLASLVSFYIFLILLSIIIIIIKSHFYLVWGRSIMLRKRVIIIKYKTKLACMPLMSLSSSLFSQFFIITRELFVPFSEYSSLRGLTNRLTRRKKLHIRRWTRATLNCHTVLVFWQKS